MVKKFAEKGSGEHRHKKLRWLMERHVYPIPRPEHTIEDNFLVIKLAARYLVPEG